MKKTEAINHSPKINGEGPRKSGLDCLRRSSWTFGTWSNKYELLTPLWSMRRPTRTYVFVAAGLVCLLWFFFASGPSRLHPDYPIYPRPPIKDDQGADLSNGDAYRNAVGADVEVEPVKQVSSQLRTHNNTVVDEKSPFIFIGGMPRSGTTLMRAMLDAHPDVRCGEETRVIPRILGLRGQWRRSEKEWNRLQQAGVNNEVINAAVGAFIIQVIAGHGAPAPRLCNKDPFTLKSTTYLSELFPNAKYLLMVRDGRATVHSIISRKVTITGFNLNDYGQCLQKWNAGIKLMVEQCEEVGPEKCMKVYYEQLVLHPEPQMRGILNFLNLPWNSSVLHHEQLIGKDISLSKVERSSDQVVKPVNVDALTKWVGQIPQEVVEDMANLAPMLQVLGYDPMANPPNYGKPDDIVLKNTDDVHKNGHEWYKKAVEVVNDPARVDPPKFS